MSDPTNDWNVWRWVLGGVGSMLSGAAFGGWVSRGMLEGIKQQLTTVKADVATLQRDQSRCQATLKDDIRQIVQQAIDHQSMRNADHLQAIRTDLAVLVALHGETQKDVQALFDRLDRRQHETALPPKGERRDQ